MKQIDTSKEIVLTFRRTGNDITCRMDAIVESDDLSETRSHIIPMSAAELTALRNFATNTAIPSFKSQEGISV